MIVVNGVNYISQEELDKQALTICKEFIREGMDEKADPATVIMTGMMLTAEMAKLSAELFDTEGKDVEIITTSKSKEKIVNDEEDE